MLTVSGLTLCVGVWVHKRGDVEDLQPTYRLSIYFTNPCSTSRFLLTQSALTKRMRPDKNYGTENSMKLRDFTLVEMTFRLRTYLHFLVGKRKSD